MKLLRKLGEGKEHFNVLLLCNNSCEKKKEASSGGVKFQVCVMSEARAWQRVGGEGGGGETDPE